jgi:hypothetical protein
MEYAKGKLPIPTAKLLPRPERFDADGKPKQCEGDFQGIETREAPELAGRGREMAAKKEEK